MIDTKYYNLNMMNVFMVLQFLVLYTICSVILGNTLYILFGFLQVLLLTSLYQGLLLTALFKVPDPNTFHTSDEMFKAIASGDFTIVIDSFNYYSSW